MGRARAEVRLLPVQASPATMGVFRITLQRKCRWFVVNHLLLIGLLTTLVFYVFVIPPTEVADRASVSFTLLLTVTAAKLVVADSLPRLSYLTVLDKYMLACLPCSSWSSSPTSTPLYTPSSMPASTHASPTKSMLCASLPMGALQPSVNVAHHAAAAPDPAEFRRRPPPAAL